MDRLAVGVRTQANRTRWTQVVRTYKDVVSTLAYDRRGRQDGSAVAPARVARTGCKWDLMIGTALRYPLDRTDGRSHFVAVTSALLVAGISMRIAGTLVPNLLVAVPIATTAAALWIAVGICTRAFLDPTRPLSGLRGLLRDGILASTVASVTLVGPLLLLAWTVVSYADGPSLDSGAAIFFLLGSTISLFTFLLATYVLPVLVAQILRTGRLSAATDQRHLRVALAQIPYLQGWSVGIVLIVLGWWAAVVGVTGPGPSGLLGIIVGGYCLLAGVRAIGIGYAAVPGVEST